MYHVSRIPETRGGMLIQGLWEIQKEAIIDVKFGDADRETCKNEVMNTLLPMW